MRATFLLSVLFISEVTTLNAQGPFQFREAFMLEHRIEVERSGEEYDPNHAERYLATEGPGPANQFVVDRNDLTVYQSSRWQALLSETDRYRRMGGLELAEREYLEMAANLRKVQGPASNDLALMLDHLGEFYLEARSFDQAYKALSDALEVRKAALAALPPPLPPANPNALEQGPRPAYRLHLADLESRLGQLDLAKGDLESANRRLMDALAIFDEPTYLRFVGCLYAVYFESLVLEKQKKFTQAEELWRKEVKLREKLFLSDPYWNAQKEMAAFYARQGDFHTAAQIMSQVQAGVAGKDLHRELPMPYLDSRPGEIASQPRSSLYAEESEVAMSEILAVDKWRSEGAEAAAALLKEPVTMLADRILDRGSDAERTELLAWFERRAFLHMSILLDGDPPQERIDKAYAMLCEIKGRYLASISQVTRMVEGERANPNAQLPGFAILDQLAKARASQAHLYLSAALDGKKVSPLEFAARENAVRTLSTALLSGNESLYLTSKVNITSLQKAVPADAALIDMVAWERQDRDGKTPPHREYAAFIVRNSQPIRFVRLGAVEPIDADIDAVHDGVLANRERGFATAAPAHVLTPEEMQKRLRSLYQKVIGPMESSLAGAATLYLVPDGKLTVAPISALIDGQGHYVLESRGVSYVDSWRDIYTSVFYGSAPPTSAIIVADPDFNLAFHGDQPAAPNVHRPIFKPLPGAEAEAADTAKELGVAADRVLTGKAARQWLVQSLESPEVLHFATHSVPHLNWKPPAPAYSLFEFPEPTDTEFPLLESVIALAGANRPQQGIEDGLLTGLEVGSLHLDGTRLAVLSSCESGQGSVVDGQGVLGLRAAFSLAGAQATVMTLWPVDDTAGRQFMQFFYARLDKGPAEAVRLAQQQMLATAQYKNPFFWSGYVVSASPVRKTMQSIERKAPPPANATTQKPEVFVTPNCYDITARLAPVGDTGGMVDVRLRIGGVVHRTQISPQQVDYDLTPFGNEIERRESTNYKGGPQVMDPEVQVGSERHWAMDLIVDHEKEKSSVAIRFGSVNAELNQRQLIQLNGGAGLFATTEFPAELPPISSYSSAFYLQGSNQIVSIKPCGATP